VDRRFDSVEARIEEVHRQMGVLHEETLARIAALPEYDGPTRAEMREGFAELREVIERRLDPLELTVREHSQKLDRIEKRSGR
jgi:hypothetical protein